MPLLIKQQVYFLLFIFMGFFSCGTCLDLVLVLMLVMKLGHMGMGMFLRFVGMLVTMFFRDFDIMMIMMSVAMVMAVFVGFHHMDMGMLMFL